MAWWPVVSAPLMEALDNGSAPEAELAIAAASVRSAYAILQKLAPFFDRFEKEARGLESFGPTLAPGLFLKAGNEPWRQDVREAFAAARAFVREMDRLAEKHAGAER
jgi:hypothetical protein